MKFQMLGCITRNYINTDFCSAPQGSEGASERCHGSFKKASKKHHGAEFPSYSISCTVELNLHDRKV